MLRRDTPIKEFTLLYLILPVFTLALVACSKPNNETQVPKEDPRLGDLQAQQKADIEEAKTLVDENGWLVTGGDGMLWTGKFAAVTCEPNIEAAELEPGRFQRDPDGETSENPDWSDWSKDAGTGLLAYAWRCGKRELLERHAAFGETRKVLSNKVPVWQMGTPPGDGRGLYLPAFIGRLYQTIFALGGQNNPQRLWPDLYSVGLVDYQAHLQVMNVWHRGEVAEALRKAGEDDATANDAVVDDAGQAPGAGLVLDLTDDQFAALELQANRDPRDPLFQAVHGTYTGDMTKAIDSCFNADGYAGEYVRCDGNPRACQLAARIFACDIVLRRFGVEL